MHSPVVSADRSAFERVRDAILGRGSPEDEEESNGPGTPVPG
jgi:hypothetical protein